MNVTGDHLPECPCFDTTHTCTTNLTTCRMCICLPLRACVQRVRAEYDEYNAMLGGIEFGAERSWDYALDAAREAVLLKHPRCTEPCEMCAEMDDWLTAIDELREEAK